MELRFLLGPLAMRPKCIPFSRCGGTGRHSGAQNVVPSRRRSSNLLFVTFLLQASWCCADFHKVGNPVRFRGLQLAAHHNRDTAQCSAEPHKLGRLGATPEPAIYCRLSLRERIDSSCYFRGAKGNYGRVRKLAKRLGREPSDFAGSTPVSTTLLKTIAWSSG